MYYLWSHFLLTFSVWDLRTQTAEALKVKFFPTLYTTSGVYNPASLLLFLRFIMHHLILLQYRSGLQTDQSSLLLWSHALVALSENDWAYQGFAFPTQSWYRLLPINLFNCSKHVFLSIPQHLHSFVAHLNFLQTSKSESLQQTIKFIHLNIKYIVFVLYSVEYR